jgi:hypothetical protein
MQRLLYGAWQTPWSGDSPVGVAYPQGRPVAFPPMGVGAATTVGREFVSPESRVQSHLLRALWLSRRQIRSWISRAASA